jgi:putative addiction module component (TIGR02574 family)
MPMTKEQVLAQAMALDPDERQEIADELLESLTPAQAAAIDAEWLREAHRRGEEIHQGIIAPVDGEQVMRDARAAVRAMRS